MNINNLHGNLVRFQILNGDNRIIVWICYICKRACRPCTGELILFQKEFSEILSIDITCNRNCPLCTLYLSVRIFMYVQHGFLCVSFILNTSTMIPRVKSIFFQMRKNPNLQMDANKNINPSLESAAGKASLHPPDGASSKMLKVVFVSLLLDLIAFAMILPLFPVLLDYYGRKDQVGLSFHSFHHKVGQLCRIRTHPVFRLS